jgi:hypothetical protein
VHSIILAFLVKKSSRNYVPQVGVKAKLFIIFMCLKANSIKDLEIELELTGSHALDILQHFRRKDIDLSLRDFKGFRVVKINSRIEAKYNLQNVD